MRLPLLILVLASRVFASWALVGSVAKNDGAGCNSSSTTTCTVTITSSTAGSSLVAFFLLTTTGSTVTGVSGGGTWTHPANCPEDTNGPIDCWVNLNATAATTSVVGTVSPTGKARGGMVFEFSHGACCIAAVDQSGNASRTANTSITGISLTAAGTNDVIVQGIKGGGVSSINGSYNATIFALQTGSAAAYLANTTSSTAPTWTTVSAVAAVNAVSLMEVPRHRVTGSLMRFIAPLLPAFLVEALR